jgi:hypothetical protein
MNNILFITAFKDIGRNNWFTHKRTNEDYFNYFLNITNNIDYTLIVYLDDEIKNELVSKYSFGKNIIFDNIKNVNTFYEKYLEEEKRVISSQEFQKKIPKHRFRKHPETWSAKYTLINHSKINFVTHAKKKYPDYNFYSWIDFGYVREINSLPKNINIETLPEKIIYQSFKIPHVRLNAIQMLQINEATIAGSAFIVANNLVETFENIYENKIKLWHQYYICDDDQSLVLQLYHENKDMFCLICDDNWFSLYNHLK